MEAAEKRIPTAVSSDAGCSVLPCDQARESPGGLLLGVAGALANLAGLWQAPGQSEARMARAEARKENEYWTESMKWRTDETKRRDAREKERRRDL